MLELTGDSFSDRVNYLKQLQFASTRTLETVEKIVNRSSNPPVIIIQSDHGSATTLGHPGKWTRPPPIEGVKERMYILYAYYAPLAEEYFYDSITPVNTFPILFNTYFGADFELLPDKSYFNDDKLPFEFLDVTEEIKEGFQ